MIFWILFPLVQTMGEGARASITISHATQVKRFTNDLLKVLKLQPEKQVLLSHLPDAFRSCFQRNFDTTSYGVCYIVDMVEELPEGTVLMEKVADDFMISVFKKTKTKEELARVKVFAKEITELFRGVIGDVITLFTLMSFKLTLFTLFLILKTLYVIFVKMRHYFCQIRRYFYISL